MESKGWLAVHCLGLMSSQHRWLAQAEDPTSCQPKQCLLKTFFVPVLVFVVSPQRKQIPEEVGRAANRCRLSVTTAETS